MVKIMNNLKYLFLLTVLMGSHQISSAQTFYNGQSINMSQSSSGNNQNQTVIINTDQNGNVQTLVIGGNNQTLKPMPCVKVKPTRRMDCRGKNLSGVQWDGLDVANGQFDRANLSQASLVNTDLTNGQFSQANLNGANLGNTNLVNANFYQATLIKANLQQANIINGDFSQADIRQANFAQTDLTNVSFDGANLSGTNLQGAGIINTSFYGTILNGTIWVDGSQCHVNNRCPKDDFFW